MASPAPWLHWTQTELTRWEGEEEEEEDDDFERRMDEDGVIGLGEEARSPPWGHSEDLEEGSPVEESPWHPRQHLDEEERGSSRGDEGPWGAESDGDPYAELSYEGRWGSGSSGSPEVLRGGRALCQPHGCSTDGGDISGLSDVSHSPTTPSRQHRGWDTSGDTGRGHRQGWTPSRSLQLHLSDNGLCDATNVEPVPKPQLAGTGLPAPGTPGSTPTKDPWSAGPPPAPQLHNRSQVPKKASPAVLLPQPGRPSRSLSPRQRHMGDKGTRGPSGPGTSTASGTQYTQYGRGRLNHPLPDLSKVGARVKIDQSYRPPRGRVLPPHPVAPRGPVGFKSPAEIVREVLLSSGEGAPPKPPTATAELPQEFRSPRQATALVQQLQDDYHKLLTKYAEAENTIDQLRLGARVSLYADPPRPSQPLAMGTVGTGCRVMSLSIPRASTAAFSTTPAPPAGAPAAAPSDGGSSPQNHSTSSPRGGCPTCTGLCHCPGTLGTPLTQRLAGQTRKLQAQVESLEDWIQAGNPPSPEQLQRFRKLKEAQDALERAYLQARQQHPGDSGDFDPDRVVEGEIFWLGLRLEELKERLEPGAGSPMLMEGPRGIVGDSEEVTGRLPRPLWRKQLRVEEDFGDLLAQYKHFKSLPESLSLEQLSLAESGSLEEVDGPTAGDSSPSNVPCRTQSLKEGADLETSPFHPLEQRAAPLSPKEPPWQGGTQGRLSPVTAEEPPATTKPSLGLPEPPRVSLSHRSSRAGSAVTQHRPSKDQRIVSPETDSGFMGSEASRVSPPVHTPEHQPHSTRTPSSLQPSIPIPTTLRPLWKREATLHPPEPVLMGIYPTDGTGGPHQPPSTPSRSSSPPGWAESGGSEGGPDGNSTHTDSEGRSCASAGGHPLSTARDLATTALSPEPLSPEPLSPKLPSLDLSHCDLLGSRLERDQAIRALRDEVRRLRRRLEESLHHSRSHPKGKAAPCAPPGRRQPVTPSSSSPKDAAPSGELSPPARGRVALGVPPVRRGRSASLPRDRPELDTTSKSDPPSAGAQATPSPQKSPENSPGVVTFRGQYTGTRYQAVTPHAAPAPREESDTQECPRCHRSGTPSAGSWAGDAVRPPRHSTPRRTHCATCRAPMGAPAPDGRDRAAHERGPGGTFPPGSRVGPRAEKPEHPGLWYLMTSPAANAATAAISCLAPVPLVPYVPSVLFCSPAVPTSAPTPAGVSPQHPTEQPPAAAPHRCPARGGLEELDRSLSRALEAARSVGVTTTRMGRALATELSRARALRGSCLF
ncbi:AT-hook-containing transcription factor isoform A [Patagioenas fasciata monilis]|uniref:AT-hook-containing transcription factor isoform A n=1 Tax=Patagioenas fasciata monilis TaxID=372326 RepID=A0A1V4J6M8_PATFA|nr:AT-hook-containing transcription factor isoform A [Patagioenas fasciata monilis]